MLNYNFNMEITTPQKSILVIDSGNGGKWTLNILKRFLPNENYIFFEDDTNVPYGKKSKKKLEKITKKNLDFLLKNYSIKTVVFACNTLSSTVDNFVKKTYPNLPFVFINPCVKNFKKNTLILCTKTTKKYNKVLKKIKENKNVKILCFKFLAQKIDENIKNLSILQHFFNKKLKKYANMNISNVVLGCTHYNFVKKQICFALTKNPLVKSQKKYQILDTKKTLKSRIIFKQNFNKNLNVNTKIFVLKNCNIKFYEGSKILAKNLSKLLDVLNIKNKQKLNGKIMFLKSSSIKNLK